MINNLTIKNPDAIDLVQALVIYYNGENLIKDFSKILKTLIINDFYEIIKKQTNGDAIIILSEKYRVTERYISMIVYNK